MQKLRIDYRKGGAIILSSKQSCATNTLASATSLNCFNGVVTPTVLYGSAAWTMNAERVRLLRTNQRRMLRWMLGGFWHGIARIAGEEIGNPTDSGDEVEDEQVDEPAHDENDEVGETETWIDWLRRRTRIAEDTIKALRLDDWVQAVGHQVRREDGRWALFTFLGAT